MTDTLERKLRLAEIDCEHVANEIGDFIVSKVLEFGATGCVLGLSGGIDSTTVAALTKRAFDNHNTAHVGEPQLELVGYVLPSNTNNPKDAEDGSRVAEFLGIRYEVQNIEPIVQAFGATNAEALQSKYHKGNMMSEIRALVLHGKAATENKKVIGTGNRDEDYSVGYYTLFGDGAVHLSPIGNLPKRLVRQMAAYLGVSADLVQRVPTAGLEHGQTDFKDLGYSYDTVELLSEGIKQGFSRDELIVHSQVAAYVRNDIEQYTAQYGTSKYHSAEHIVDDILRRHAIAEKKAQLVNPPIAEITLRYAA